MSGIRILNVMNVGETSIPQMIFMGIGAFLAVLALIFAIKSITRLMALCIVGALFCTAMVSLLPDNMHQEIEAIVEPNISYEQIEALYDVVEQRGDIWVLKDKDGVKSYLE